MHFPLSLFARLLLLWWWWAWAWAWQQKPKIAKLLEEKDKRTFAEVTLHPVINPQSHSVPNRSAEQQYLYYKLYEKRREDKAAKYRTQELAECTFKPKTNKASCCCVLCFGFSSSCSRCDVTPDVCCAGTVRRVACVRATD